MASILFCLPKQKCCSTESYVFAQVNFKININRRAARNWVFSYPFKLKYNTIISHRFDETNTTESFSSQPPKKCRFFFVRLSVGLNQIIILSRCPLRHVKSSIVIGKCWICFCCPKQLSPIEMGRKQNWRQLFNAFAATLKVLTWSLRPIEHNEITKDSKLKCMKAN